MAITVPNEITLAQLVTYCILPSGIQLDVSSVFYWNLLRIQDKSKADKTKWTVQEIPDEIPIGFSLRVKCSSLRENSTKKMVNCRYGSVLLPFAMPDDALLGRLKERVADWMNQRGQGPDWTIEGGDREQIEFDYEYEVISAIREVPVKIYLKQLELMTASSQSWMDISDLLVEKFRLPKGTLFRIYPVVGTVDNQDAEDHFRRCRIRSNIIHRGRSGNCIKNTGGGATRDCCCSKKLERTRTR
jgi:hypothetical protein